MAQEEPEYSKKFQFNIQSVVVQHIPAEIELLIPKLYINSDGKVNIQINDSVAMVNPVHGKFIFARVFHHKEELNHKHRNG